jgi:hypothetical protein
MVHLHRALTSRDDEPIRCSIDTISMDDWSPEYQSWLSTQGQNMSHRRRIVEWHIYVDQKLTGPRKFDPERFCRFSWGDFFAISYAWGSTDLSDTIILEGKAVKVPRSVNVALRSVRSMISMTNMGSNACFVWIDFLCINQQDTLDKSQQVMRMQNIFGQAYLNLIHLGESEDDSDLAMDLTLKVGVYSNKGFDYKQHLVDRWAEVKRGEKARILDQAAFAAVSKLFTRRYWGRMWIIQELAMADDVSLILCGSRITDLHSMRLMAKVYAENHEIIAEMTRLEYPLFLFSDIGPAMALLRWIGRLRQQMHHQKEPVNITYPELRSPLLSLAQSANATHQYDKIFGMLALLPKDISAAMKPLLAELPTVVERISMHQNNLDQAKIEAAFLKKVFIHFVISIIRATNDLDVIFARNTFQSFRSKLDLPSWVTDWTLKPDRSSHIPSHEWYFASEEGIYNRLIEEQQDNPLLSPQKWLSSLDGRRADAGKSGEFRFSGDSRLLTCQGFLIGVVDGIAPEWVHGVGSENNEAKWLEESVQPQCDQSPYGDESQTLRALLRTLFFDPLDDSKQKSLIFNIPWLGGEAEKVKCAASGEGSPSEDLEKITTQLVNQGWDPRTGVRSFPRFESLRHRIGSFRMGGKPFKEYFPSQSVASPMKLLDNDLLILLSNFENRRLVTTATGHFGFAPSSVRPGDSVSVILGCSIPVILRPADPNGCYEVVGECYVEGFMKGEYITDVENRKRKAQDIVLC